MKTKAFVVLRGEHATRAGEALALPSCRSA